MAFRGITWGPVGVESLRKLSLAPSSVPTSRFGLTDGRGDANDGADVGNDRILRPGQRSEQQREDGGGGHSKADHVSLLWVVLVQSCPHRGPSGVRPRGERILR